MRLMAKLLKTTAARWTAAQLHSADLTSGHTTQRDRDRKFSIPAVVLGTGRWADTQWT